MISPKREAEVWNRVMAASAEAPECCKVKKTEELTAEQVMELLQAELCDGRTYEALACRVRGDVRRRLLMLSQQERSHYAKLEAVYYLMTGKKPCPDRPKPPCIACINEELRCRYREEVKGAQLYHCLAKKAGSFETVFHELGAEEEKHAYQVLCLLQQCL